jgi:alpha-tubulin suppressor-like RCC1 family protein
MAGATSTGFLAPTGFTRIPGFAGTISQISIGGAGYNSTNHPICAILSDKTVGCYDSSSGVLGSYGTPALVPGLTNITKVSASITFACALTSGGGVMCWGQNGYGQLGDGTNSDNTTPVQALASGATDIVTMNQGACALMSGQTVKCWGNNGSGQLGDGTTNDSNSPVTVTGLSGVTAIAGGMDHACAVAAGAVKCWGNNNSGKLGDNTTTNRSSPVSVSGISGTASNVALGGDHSCALLSDHTVMCWGGNFTGQLGDSTFAARHVATQVTGITTATSIGAARGST